MHRMRKSRLSSWARRRSDARVRHIDADTLVLNYLRAQALGRMTDPAAAAGVPTMAASGKSGAPAPTPMPSHGCRRSPRSAAAFTLVELLIALAIGACLLTAGRVTVQSWLPRYHQR